MKRVPWVLVLVLVVFTPHVCFGLSFSTDWIDELDKKVDGLAASIELIRKKMDDLDKKIDELVKKLDGLEKKLDLPGAKPQR